MKSNEKRLHPIVVFGEDWDRHPSSTQHLMRGLREQRKMLWVNSIGLRKPKWSWTDAKRIVEKLKNTFVGSKTTQSDDSYPNFKITNPLIYPCSQTGLFRQLNRWFLKLQIKLQMKKLGIEKPLLWLSLPSGVDMVDNLDEFFTVYYCGDDFSALAGVDHDHVQSLEHELAQKADLILVASVALAQKFPAGKTAVLPHGVDAELFSTKQQRPRDLPEGKPIAGFYGSLSEWIDEELLIVIAEQLPHWNLVLIGNEHRDLSSLKQRSNVFFLGEKSHNELPGYVQHWQCSLLPFIDNQQIRACNPLKLREYLAAGTPVVSMDFPAVRDYHQLVTLCKDRQQFVEAIEFTAADVQKHSAYQLLRIESWSDVELLAEAKLNRQAAVESETWQARINLIRRMIPTMR